MKVPTYRGCVGCTAWKAITFWAHFNDWAATLALVTKRLFWCLWMLIGAALTFGLILFAPLLVLLSPITGWIKYRREMRRYEAQYARDREGMDA